MVAKRRPSFNRVSHYTTILIINDTWNYRIVEQKGIKDDWEQCARRIGRSAADCSDRYRHLKRADNTNRGRWTNDEIALLEKSIIKIVGDTDTPATNINFNLVAAEMNGTRNAVQCRQRW